MRLDLFLKRVGLLKRRGLAKDVCDAGLVRLDGLIARPGKEITPGRVVEIDLESERLQFEVLALPERNYKKEQGRVFYKTIEHEYKERYS